MAFPYYKQPDQMDCGPTCLRMVAKHFGRSYKLQTLRQLTEISKNGVSLLGICDAAVKIGFDAFGIQLNFLEISATDLPCMLHWQQNHFVVLYKIKNNKYYIADPANRLLCLNEFDFKNKFKSREENEEGFALVLKTTDKFYELKGEEYSGIKWDNLFCYFITYRKLFIQLLLGLGIGSVIQLATPFLTQSIVDVGINTHNLNFIFIILIAQIALIIGQVSVDFIRSWILLHISTRINISILTDFLIKLMRLPMSYFDTKMIGDIMQRLSDQQNIQSFLTGSALTTLFSLINLIIFSVVLAYYNSTIFFVFALSSTLYVGWIVLFLNKRREINYKTFEISAKNQSNIIQLVGGMQEIKLNNCEQQKRWEWEYIQAGLFNINVKSLVVKQYQQSGTTLINQGKNILITFLSAEAVIKGNLTLGGMVAIQYIVGQLSNPIEQLLNFTQSFQDAKISIERLNEIYQIEDEEPVDRQLQHKLPYNKSIKIDNLTFRYPGTDNDPVLENIDLLIPQGKTTAIVGMSGSGKTTILKLLLRFYEPQAGEIAVGDDLLTNISFKTWRSQCGVVMQDGFIFSDTIERNIAVGDDSPDKEKLLQAIKLANIQDFIDELPLGVVTKIGAEGNGISQGQRQRILIARAIYKNPHYLFFDEATNALDANNENIIMDNLSEFFKDRTVVIVAHRLSTVKNADNIEVMRKGHIIEQGTHQELTSFKGDYYTLVKNQLELGN